MDVHSPEQRSRNMAAIRSKDTKPELYFRKLIFACGYRYRLYSKKIPGKPDLWLAKYKTAIFVHGCFWHRHHGCRFATTPKSNEEYWQQKFRKNKERDELVKNQILNMGLKYMVIWECTIHKMMKDKELQNKVLSEIRKFLTSDKNYISI